MDTRTYNVGSTDIVMTNINSEATKQATKTAINSMLLLLKTSVEPSHKYANLYMKAIEKIATEYEKTLDLCTSTKKAIDVVTTSIKNKDGDVFLTQTFPAYRKAFEALHSHYGAQLADSKLCKIPKLNEEKVPSDLLSEIKRAKDSVSDIRNTGNEFFEQIQNMNTAIMDFAKSLVEEIKKRKADAASNNSAPVQPITQPSSGIAMSSMYGAKQLASQQKAAQAQVGLKDGMSNTNNSVKK
jgi:translation initiation factor 2B subunit (eIF-2B alpha/beta/delta family)